MFSPKCFGHYYHDSIPFLEVVGKLKVNKQLQPIRNVVRLVN